MKMFGVEFAPLNVPLERRLQTLAVATYFSLTTFGAFIAPILATYMVLFTSWRWVILIYLSWAWGIDGSTCEKGGRRSKWVRDLIIWKYARQYFPLKLEKLPGVELDRKRNYLFCSFPHGIMSTSAFIAFCTNAAGFSDLFPHHTPHFLTISLNYYIPFYREYALSLGGGSVSEKSLNYILSSPSGGNVANLTIGGAAEAVYSQPGHYRLVLRKRKGFVKVALKNGSPLVPVFSFGETDLFSQASYPEGSAVRNFQEMFKRWTGIFPVCAVGRGFFQYTFGFIPRRKPLTTLVGCPIDVDKVDNPTKGQIDALHEKFIEELTKLFEEHKHTFLKDSENIKLEIK